MKILETSDWKYRIAFDNITYKNVKRYSLMLNTYEREIMDEQINFFRKHFSICQVMDHFKKLKTKTDREIFIKAVLKRQDGIYYLPLQLKSYMLKKIRTEFKDYSQFFELLLNKALNQSKTNIVRTLYKNVLKDYFRPSYRLVCKYRKQQEIPVIQKMLKPEAYLNTARNLIHDLQFDYKLSQVFGRSSIRKSVPISIVDDYGYGEWISKNVSYNNNRFFIYSNHNKLTDVALKHMVYFNVYPGYGYFYNTVASDVTKNTCFDNGASLIINGWAMYAMCRNGGTAYSQNFLIEGSNITWMLFNKNLEKAYESVYVYLLGKYPKSKAMDYMLDYTQKPGHYLSYVMGEVAIEVAMSKGFANTPVEFLDNLSQVNVGDYICLYNPKKQRKIGRNVITSKVVEKFYK